MKVLERSEAQIRHGRYPKALLLRREDWDTHPNRAKYVVVDQFPAFNGWGEIFEYVLVESEET